MFSTDWQRDCVLWRQVEKGYNWSWSPQLKEGNITNHTLKSSAWKWHPWWPLMFLWPRQITWLCLTSKVGKEMLSYHVPAERNRIPWTPQLTSTSVIAGFKWEKCTTSWEVERGLLKYLVNIFKLLIKMQLFQHTK